MARQKSWSVKGIDAETRDVARLAAQRAGMPIGAWVDRAILRAGRGDLTEFAASDPQENSLNVPTDAPDAPPSANDARGTRIEPGHQPSDDHPVGISESEPPRLEEDLLAPEEAGEPADAVGTSPGQTAGIIGLQPDRQDDDPEPSGSPIENEALAGFSERPQTTFQTYQSIPPVEHRSGKLKIAATALVLLAVLAGGIWFIAELSEETPTQIIADKTPGTSSPASENANSDQAAPSNSLITHLTELATGGDMRAQYDLGLRYLKGDSVQEDAAEAAKWIQFAADQGLPAAQLNLAKLYRDGNGIGRDPQKAFFWFQAAAEHNLPEALHAVALAFARGNGVSQNDIMAFQWYRKAAQAGKLEAQLTLATLLESGRGGVPPNLEEARQWYARAADQGSARAATRLKEIGPPDGGVKTTAMVTPERELAPAAGAAPSRELSGTEIREIQSLLQRLNFDPGPVDGQIGRKTVDAIRLYQEFAGVRPDGKASMALLEDLRAISETLRKGS